jgi:hypothetical protein
MDIPQRAKAWILHGGRFGIEKGCSAHKALIGEKQCCIPVFGATQPKASLPLENGEYEALNAERELTPEELAERARCERAGAQSAEAFEKSCCGKPKKEPAGAKREAIALPMAASRQSKAGASHEASALARQTGNKSA